MTPVLLDTGAIVALIDRSEKHHDATVKVLKNLERPLVTCEGVIAEACYLLRQFRGGADAILENVDRGIFQIPFLLNRSAAQVSRILRKRGNRTDFADACLIELADQLGTGDILTLDPDFEFYRWRRNRPFNLLLPRG